MGRPELKASARRFGQLYPILVDYHGEIIDGEHRFQVDRNWRRVKLDYVKTEKDRLVARIIANNVRRSVTPVEKRQLLKRLAHIHLSQGERPGEIAQRIAGETGMSYRWVVKYLPFEFKDNLQSERASAGAHCAAGFGDEFSKLATKNTKIVIQTYSNTSFVAIAIAKSYYREFEDASSLLGVPTEMSILEALEEHYKKMRRLIQLKRMDNPNMVDMRKTCKQELQN